MKTRIISVVGARPQFIKAALLTRELRMVPDLEEILVHTGQHYDFNMSEIFLVELNIPTPDRYLGIGSGTHAEQTGKMLIALEETFLELKPRLVLVYGDTNTTLAGALAAIKLHIPVAHVEAGLRSYNRRMPEEINRIVTDHLSELLFAPTDRAVKNLLREGIPQEKIHLVGDVMYDAYLFFRDRIPSPKGFFTRLNLPEAGYILVTLHRAENTDDHRRLEKLLSVLFLLAEKYHVVFPVHPRTARHLPEEKKDRAPKKLHYLEPVGYLEMLALEQNAALIATDSGGVQKEAYFHGVPCVTLRNETEWVELVETGWNIVVSPELPPEEIARRIESRIGMKGSPVRLYGEGNAIMEIVARIRRYLG